MKLDPAVEQIEELSEKFSSLSKDGGFLIRVSDSTPDLYAIAEYIADEITRAKQETLNTVDREVIGEDEEVLEESGLLGMKDMGNIYIEQKNKLKATQRVALNKLRKQ